MWSENDFYKHLLCILSNVSSRDNFILVIAFMEALYRYDIIRVIASLDEITVNNATELFKYLKTCLSVKQETLTSTETVYSVIENLGIVLKNNLTVIDMLSRYVVRHLVSDLNVSSSSELTTILTSIDIGPVFDSAYISLDNCYKLSDVIYDISHYDNKTVIVFLLNIYAYHS